MSPLVSVNMLRVLHSRYCFSCFNFLFFWEVFSAECVELVGSFKWSLTGFFHITFSEWYLHLLLPVVWNASDKTWVEFLTHALFTCFWGVGMSAVRGRYIPEYCFQNVSQSESCLWFMLIHYLPPLKCCWWLQNPLGRMDFEMFFCG